MVTRGNFEKRLELILLWKSARNLDENAGISTTSEKLSMIPGNTASTPGAQLRKLQPTWVGVALCLVSV